MYMGDNPTARRSQKWLSDSLISLMHEKPYKKITIADIYLKADLSRQTFYNLFETKEEVLRFYLEDHYQPPLRELKKKIDASASDIVQLFAIRMVEDREFLLLLLDNGLEGLLRDEFIHDVNISDRFIHLPPNDPRMPYVSEMISGAFVNALIYWLRSEESITIEELTTTIQQLLSGKLIHFA